MNAVSCISMCTFWSCNRIWFSIILQCLTLFSLVFLLITATWKNVNNWLLCKILFLSRAEHQLQNKNKYPSIFYCFRSEHWFLLMMLFDYLDTVCLDGSGWEEGETERDSKSKSENLRKWERTCKKAGSGCIFISEFLSVHFIPPRLEFISHWFIRIQNLKALENPDLWTFQNLEINARNA